MSEMLEIGSEHCLLISREGDKVQKQKLFIFYLRLKQCCFLSRYQLLPMEPGTESFQFDSSNLRTDTKKHTNLNFWFEIYTIAKI